MPYWVQECGRQVNLATINEGKLVQSCLDLVKFSITIAGLQQIVLIHPLVQIA